MLPCSPCSFRFLGGCGLAPSVRLWGAEPVSLGFLLSGGTGGGFAMADLQLDISTTCAYSVSLPVSTAVARALIARLSSARIRTLRASPQHRGHSTVSLF